MTFDLAVESVISGVPSIWKVEPFRRLSTLVTEVRGKRDIDLLSLSSAGVVAPRVEEGGLGKQPPAAETMERYWVARPGDLVVNPMWLVGGGIGVSQVHGAVSPDYRVYRLSSAVHPRYMHYLLRSQPYRDQYRLYTRADTTFDRRISKENFHPMPIVVPPLDEQRRIADFLDSRCSHLEKLQGARRLQMDAVDSREASLLSAATLFDGARKVRIKYLASRITSGPRGWGDLVSDEGSPFLRIANIPRRGIELLLDNLLNVSAPAGPERERTRTVIGDVLVSITADIGSVGIVGPATVDANVSQHLCLVRPRTAICDPRWLAYSLKSPASADLLKMNSYGGTKVGLSLADVAETPISLPDLSDQMKRVDVIDRKMVAMLQLRQTLSGQLDLLEGRKRALVTAAVTGQMDVTTARGFSG